MLEIACEATYYVSEKEKGKRLDRFLAEKDLSLSRTRIQTLIKNGYVRVNNEKTKCSYKVKLNDQIHLFVPIERPLELEPEYVNFDIIYEDSYVIIIDKPPGVVIHPAPGHYQSTLVHGLLYRCKDLSGIGGILRPGIVHRLDKDTSGIMLIAKNDIAHNSLTLQFKNGLIEKEYWALVHGPVKESKGIIDLPIARHPIKRKKMSVSESGKKAITIWRKISEFPGNFALLSVFPKTGRTHQIRVHLSHIGYPVVGDPVYGKRKTLPVSRQMLHAKRITFYHSQKKKKMEFSSYLPNDMKKLFIELNKKL